jgi:hypothetical protein
VFSLRSRSPAPWRGTSVEIKKGYAVPLNRAEDVVNTARVCGTVAQAPVCSSPAVHLDVLHPAVTADAVAVIGSGTVTYTYVVKNTGDIALANRPEVGPSRTSTAIRSPWSDRGPRSPGFLQDGPRSSRKAAK